MRLEARPAGDEAHELGEGPLWDPVRERLLWVDIRRGTVFSGRLAEGGRIYTQDRMRFDSTVGAVVVSDEGELLVAGKERLLAARGLREPAVPVARLLPRGSGRRLNDGSADPAGRFLVGTLSHTGPSTTEALLSVDRSGTVRAIDEDLTLSNGLVWSAAGTTLYSVDTGRRTVFRRPYRPETGETGPREVFIAVEEGFPDGMAIDEEEHLWIAIWGSGEVRRYSPAGTLEATVVLPAPHTSSVAFAGRELDTLVITTATQDLSGERRAEYPLSGRLFTVKPGVRGLPQPLWSGTSATSTNKRNG